MRRSVMALMGVVLMASAVSAQTTGGGYVEGFAGLVRVPDKTSGLIGGEVGFEVIENLQVFGNLGFALNVASEDPDDPLVEACEFAGVDCDIKARMTFFTGGAKYLFPTNTTVRPYAALGLGVARIAAKIEVDGEDITDEVEDELDQELSDTSGLLEVGGGIELAVGTNGKVDVGYRLMKVFEDDTDVAHRFYGGFGWRF